MVRLAVMFLVAVLAGFGAFFAGGFGDDARVLKWTQRHLEIVRDQLADIESMLRDFKKTHGRYPGNNEGLAALNGYESRFFVMLHREDEKITDDSRSGKVAFHDNWWPNQKQAVQEFRKTHDGRAPRNAEDLAATPLGKFLERLAPDTGESAQVELGIAKSGNVFFLGAGGIFDPWLVPYMYENRAECDPNFFRISRVNRDPARRYSICLDNQVYVYTISGEPCALYCDTIQTDYNVLQVFGFVLCGASLLVALVYACLARRVLLPLAVVVGFLTAGALGAWSLRGKLPMSSPMFYHRSPGLQPVQRYYLDNYRSRGVFGEQALQRYLQDMYLGPVKALAPAEVEDLVGTTPPGPHVTTRPTKPGKPARPSRTTKPAPASRPEQTTRPARAASAPVK